jgi:hypothetical protein|tara:strand:- start:3637 stop:3978 length:342 start_codon:yes stop_codon:yes gene_type:complete
MTAAVYNLVIDQGSDFAINLTIKELGAVKDLSGFSARAQMRSARTSSTVAATFTCTVLSPATDGIVKMQLGNGVSSALTAGRYFYDLEIHTNADAVVRRLIQGEVTLNPEITR